MPNLRIAKVIFEPKDPTIRPIRRTIVQLSWYEIAVIQETERKKSITRQENARKLDEKEYYYLEELFWNLLQYAIPTSEYMCDHSRLDYLYPSGKREVYMINDDGPSVVPWLKILNFIKYKLHIDLTSNGNTKVNANSSSNRTLSNRTRNVDLLDDVSGNFKNWLNEINNKIGGYADYDSKLKNLLQHMHDTYNVPKIIDLDSIDPAYWDEIKKTYEAHSSELKVYNKKRSGTPHAALRRRIEYNKEINRRLANHESTVILLHF